MLPLEQKTPSIQLLELPFFELIKSTVASETPRDSLQSWQTFSRNDSDQWSKLIKKGGMFHSLQLNYKDDSLRRARDLKMEIIQGGGGDTQIKLFGKEL